MTENRKELIGKEGPKTLPPLLDKLEIEEAGTASPNMVVWHDLTYLIWCLMLLSSFSIHDLAPLTYFEQISIKLAARPVSIPTSGLKKIPNLYLSAFKKQFSPLFINGRLGYFLMWV